MLEATPDNDLEQVLLDYVSTKWPENAGNDYGWLEPLPPALQMVWSTLVVDGELGNGGFNQFFFNGTDRFAPAAIAGFRAIGARNVAELVDQALSRVAETGDAVGASWGDGSLEDFMDSYQEGLFSDLDQRFVGLYGIEDRHALFVRWIRQHADELLSD